MTGPYWRMMESAKTVLGTNNICEWSDNAKFLLTGNISVHENTVARDVVFEFLIAETNDANLDALQKDRKETNSWSIHTSTVQKATINTPLPGTASQRDFAQHALCPLLEGGGT